MTPWQFEGVAVLAAWLASEERAELRDYVVNWLTRLRDDPLAVGGEAVPGRHPDMRALFIPGTSVAVTFLPIRQYRVVKLVELTTPPF